MRHDQQQNNVRIPIERDLEPWAARRNNKSRRAQERLSPKSAGVVERHKNVVVELIYVNELPDREVQYC